MIRPVMLAVLPLLALGACANAAVAMPTPRPPGPAARLSGDQPASKARFATHRQAARGLPSGIRTTPRRPAPLERVAAANRKAVLEPASEAYVGASQIYPWTEGALYRLYAAPGEVSDIALQAGERLISVAAGDTVRWIMGDTVSGSGAARRIHILVKPVQAGLRTNLVIATDRRVYHVQARSMARTAMVAIAWTYADDGLLALRAEASPAAAAPAAAEAAVESLNFDYRIEGDAPPWRPVRAFDDGHQVFIEFPASLAGGEAPPLFVIGDTGADELVNYRVRGRYYLVDRLFAAAELRLGGKRQQVVRIVRAPGGPERRGRRQ
jgi:P-type conjugative transfer protein TrbG